MSPKPDALTVVTSWTNGRKAVVYLVEDKHGAKLIRKVYRTGWRHRMFRDYVMTAYVSHRVSITPRVLAFRPWRSEILLQYLPGERVLEWVLSRLGHNLNLAEFQSFHGLMPPHNVDPRVSDAFRRFRESTADDVLQLKTALRASYSLLHSVGIKHGSADPRNVLYDAGRIFIIDFDNSRPSLRPSESDNIELEYWYGI